MMDISSCWSTYQFVYPGMFLQQDPEPQIHSGIEKDTCSRLLIFQLCRFSVHIRQMFQVVEEHYIGFLNQINKLKSNLDVILISFLIILLKSN